MPTAADRAKDAGTTEEVTHVSAEADKAAADLDSVSEDIGQAATEVSRLQIDSYNKARMRADAATDALEAATATTAAALEMVANVHALSLAEIKAVRARDEAEPRETVIATIELIDSGIDSLAAIATGEKTAIPGSRITRTPMNPTPIAAQRRQPTVSPKTGPESAATKSG